MRYGAGLGQGCPLSALLFCLALAVRVCFVEKGVGCISLPAGQLRTVNWMDDSTGLALSSADCQKILTLMERAGQATNLFSDSGKLRAFGVNDNGGVSQFHSAPLRMYGAPVQTHNSGNYIRVLGRHLVPNIFHKEELRRLMISGRRAAAAVRVGSLPANYPILMYTARAGGFHRWLGGIRPPIASVCRLGDIPVAGNLRSIWGGGERG